MHHYLCLSQPCLIFLGTESFPGQFLLPMPLIVHCKAFPNKAWHFKSTHILSNLYFTCVQAGCPVFWQIPPAIRWFYRDTTPPSAPDSPWALHPCVSIPWVAAEKCTGLGLICPLVTTSLGGGWPHSVLAPVALQQSTTKGTQTQREFAIHCALLLAEAIPWIYFGTVPICVLSTHSLRPQSDVAGAHQPLT